MKRTRCLLFVAIICQGSSIHAEQQGFPNASAETFSDVLIVNPGRSVQATLHMRHEVSLGDITQMFNNSPVLVKSFRHRSISGEGGYGVGNSETLAEAVKAYQRDHLYFLEQRLDDEQKMLGSIQEPGLHKAILVHIDTTKRAKSEYLKGGLRITHIAVTGSAEAVLLNAGTLYYTITRMPSGGAAWGDIKLQSQRGRRANPTTPWYVDYWGKWNAYSCGTTPNNVKTLSFGTFTVPECYRSWHEWDISTTGRCI